MSRAAAPLRRPDVPQRATFLELFFDLAFVFALFQLSHTLVQRLHWSGAIQALVLLLVVWWVWAGTTWITDRLDPQRPAVQLVVFATLVSSLILAATLPEAFGRYGLVFAGVYVGIQIGRALSLALALRGHELQRLSVRALLWWSAAAAPWIIGGLLHGTARVALWALAIAVDYTAYALGFTVPGTRQMPAQEPPAAAEHLAERFQQFFIIALGELILVSGITVSGGGFAPGRTPAFVVSIATTALFWRIYLYRAGELLSAAFAAVPKPALLGRWAGYAHLTMVGGIVVTAVGAQLVIAHPFGRTAPAWAAVILGGPVLFLAGRGAFEYTVFGRVSWNRPIAALVLAALAPVTLHASPLLAAVVATAILAGIAITDAARARVRPSHLPWAAGGPP